MTLKDEYDYFRSRLDDLLSHHHGQYAVVKDQEIKEILDTHADAWKWSQAKGYEPETFVIQEIVRDRTNVVMNAA